jgi:hypothetical protein
MDVAFSASHAFPPETRAKIRAWLEKVREVGRTGYEWNIYVTMRVNMDGVDEAGNLLGWEECQLAPATLLEAISTWDAGEDFAPRDVLP